ncbi:endonuclease VIII [Candidatus Symbiopectobacterium sp. 'North America']|uniref:endonuclease VIII n=1 Tax=Candidatus Symbiopectobacterium sp. 'North America' TaxID=2794574 RepID=UPI0018CA38DD|nr:endonuclease VIII [Candidatus Symbiopectobacterium sp. 'North America']MBG6244291.1 endonuclease VIII [Candidatus Symbiopectobacterium sp. 'North America']
MPEGPEIRRAADALAAAVAGDPLTGVWFAFPELKPYETELTGQRIEKLETRGKALLTYFSTGRILYTHNQLYGLWRVVDTGVVPDTKRDLRVRLETQHRAILLYSASDIAMLTPDALETHPFLQRIGPDVLDMRVTPQQVQTRLLSERFRRRRLSGLLLDQAFLAGLGNYLRAEILWHAALSPQHTAMTLDEGQLAALSDALLSLPRLSYHTRGTVDDNHHHGALFRFNVFDREGKPCERCGHPIVRTMLSSRPFFWCPHCQH